jgi:outer membrane receptor protein involved in Fe transport
MVLFAKAHFARQLLVGTALTALLSTTPAVAQTDAQAAAESSEGMGDEIVVTALRRATNLQETPLAISAVTGNTLTTMGVTDSNGLARVSPGLVVREGGFSGSRVTIRNIRAAGEATVGLYYDDVPLMGSSGVSSDAGGTTPDIRLFDVDRVEVLRGPQGTLYGSSSMAGTVRLIFAKPKLNKTEATVTGQISAVDGGSMGFENQAMVNVPIVSDLLAIRAVGFVRERPGYVDNVTLGQKNVNDQFSTGGRIMARLEPAPGLTIDGVATFQNLKGGLNDYFLASGSYKRNYEADQPVRDKFRLYSGTINWDLGPVTLTAVGSHAYRNFNYSYDISAFFRVNAARFPVGSATYNLLNNQAPAVANSPQITKTDTFEARISGSGKGPFQWTGGFFYSDRKGDFASNILRAAPGSGDVLPVNATNLLGQRLITDGLKQKAGFAEATYEVTDQLSVTGGIRYYDYTRKVTGVVTVVNTSVGFGVTPFTSQSSSENGWLYKGNVSYKITPDVMLYATASSGQRPGGVNQNVSLPADLQSYASDKVWNYEAGIKSSLFDRLLTLNAALFQIDWNNMQTSGTLPGTNFGFIANAGRARVRGIEAEATLYPLDGLQIQASGSYIDAVLREDQTNQSLLASGLKGDDIPSVPKVTLQGGAQYDWDLSPTLKANVRSDVFYNSSTWTEFRHTSAFQRRLPAYAVVSLRAGFGAQDDNWSASLFINNLFNDDTVISKLSANVYGGLDNVRAISNVPRTIGIDFTKRF